MATTAKGSSKPGPATPGVFDLTDEHTAALSAQRGRPSEPSQYLDGVREALKTGATRGVEIKGADTAAKEKEGRRIYAQLKKAAKQLSDEMKKTIRVNTNTVYDHPKLGSFVAFSAVEAEPTPTDES